MEGLNRNYIILDFGRRKSKFLKILKVDSREVLLLCLLRFEFEVDLDLDVDVCDVSVIIRLVF